MSTSDGNGDEWSIVYYTLPVEQVEEGMSTDDGQEILHVSVWPDDSAVLLDVFTPRSDDPNADAANRADGECRAYAWGEPVGLAVYLDTEVDGSEYPDAVVRTMDEILDP